MAILQYALRILITVFCNSRLMPSIILRARRRLRTRVTATHKTAAHVYTYVIRRRLCVGYSGVERIKRCVCS